MLRIPRGSTLHAAPFLPVLLLTCGMVWASSATEPVHGPRLGLMLEPSNAVGLTRVDDGDVRPPVRVEARWDRVERFAGAYDWTEVGPAIESLNGAGYQVVLALVGSNPLYLADGAAPSPLVEGSMEAWTGFLRGAVRNFADRVSVFEIGDNRARSTDRDADIQALVIKQSALAVRAEAGRRPVRVAQGAVRSDDLDWQVKLWERDVAAYVDILPVAVTATEDPRSLEPDIEAFFRERLLHPPASALWVYPTGGVGWDGASAAVAALNAGASVALFAHGLLASYEGVLAARIGVGLLASGTSVAAMGVVGSQTPTKRRGSAMGAMFSSRAMALSLGAISGGSISALIGIRGLFLAGGVLIALASLCGFLRRAFPEGVRLAGGGGSDD